MGRQVEITEPTGIREGAVKYELGDIVTMPEEVANKWVHFGWAKCVQTGEQGTRKPGAHKLNVDDFKQGSLIA